MNKTLENEITQLHAEICAGLADPNRIMLLYSLSQSARNVTELCNELEMPQPLISRHLKVLRERGMVTTERRGTVIVYSLADKRLIEALDLLRAVMHDNISKRAELVHAYFIIFPKGDLLNENFSYSRGRHRRHNGRQQNVRRIGSAGVAHYCRG